jgi:hypothetical protein
LSGYLFRATRHVEDDLPDHDVARHDPIPHPLAAMPEAPLQAQIETQLEEV